MEMGSQYKAHFESGLVIHRIINFLDSKTVGLIFEFM